MNSAQRLQDYNAFSPEVIDTVSEFAARQVRFDNYYEFFNAMNIGNLFEVKETGVLDIRPEEFNTNEALVYHLPMANPLDENMVYQVATIAGTNPDKRVIAFANPSGPGNANGALKHDARTEVAASNFGPVVEPVLRYLDSHGIEYAEHVGGSYGADLALTAVTNGVQEVNRAVVIEPVPIKKRNLGLLAVKFMLTNNELSKYVDDTELDTFKDARKDSTSLAAYAIGLARLTNLAIARGLAKGGFEDRLDKAMKVQPNLITTIAWGTESELAQHDIVSMLGYARCRSTGSKRYRPVKLDGQKHALINDVHLQAAIVREGLIAA